MINEIAKPSPDQLIGEICLKIINAGRFGIGPFNFDRVCFAYAGFDDQFTMTGDASKKMLRFKAGLLSFSVVAEWNAEQNRYLPSGTTVEFAISEDDLAGAAYANLIATWAELRYPVRRDDDWRGIVALDLFEKVGWPANMAILPAAAEACGYKYKLVRQSGGDPILHIIGENGVWFSLGLNFDYHHTSNMLHLFGARSQDDITASIDKMTEKVDGLLQAPKSTTIVGTKEGLAAARKLLQAKGCTVPKASKSTITLDDTAAVMLRMVGEPEGICWLPISFA